MTAATKGVYITLICMIYENEGPVPQSWATLARRCGCTNRAFKKAIDDLIDDSKIEVTEKGIWSEKCAKHISARRQRSVQAAAAAGKRWGKSEQKQGPTSATALLAQCLPEPEPKPNNPLTPLEGDLDFISLEDHKKANGGQS